MAKKGKLHKMPERGVQITLRGQEIGPKVSERDAVVITRWLNGTWKTIVAMVRQASMQLLPGWQCMCACHRLRQATYHCVGCSDGKYKK